MSLFSNNDYETEKANFLENAKNLSPDEVLKLSAFYQAKQMEYLKGINSKLSFFYMLSILSIILGLVFLIANN